MLPLSRETLPSHNRSSPLGCLVGPAILLSLTGMGHVVAGWLAASFAYFAALFAARAALFEGSLPLGLVFMGQ